MIHSKARSLLLFSRPSALLFFYIAFNSICSKYWFCNNLFSWNLKCFIPTCQYHCNNIYTVRLSADLFIYWVLLTPTACNLSISRQLIAKFYWVESCKYIFSQHFLLQDFWSLQTISSNNTRNNY